MPENTLGQSVCRICYFWLVWLVNLNTGGPWLHCTCFLLYLISKVIEKLTHDQTHDYLQRNRLFYIYQSVFRTNHSTDICLSWLTDMILNGAENGKHWYDFNQSSEGFWNVRSYNLFDKMKCISFSDKKNKMVSFYLTSRAFFHFIGQLDKIPHGSLLGPLLFLLCINDIPQALSDSHTYLCVGNTNIFYQHIRILWKSKTF